MTDTQQPVPTHENAEAVLDAQGILISRLPNSIEKREAERLHGVISDLVHESIEKIPPFRG